MRILVAGGEGQVGSSIAELGAEKGLDVIALGRSELDVTNASSIESSFRKFHPKLLINAAAYTAVDKAERESSLAYEINQKATALLAEACAAAKVPMLHLSTDYVFDGSKLAPYTEKDPVHPISVYAKSKEAGEVEVRSRLTNHVILRTSWVFGKQGTNFVKTIVRLSQDRDRINVVDDQIGGPTSARGIAEVLLRIVAKIKNGETVTWGTYNYCEEPYVSWYQFAKTIVDRALELEILRRGVEIVPIPSSQFPTPAQRPRNSCLKMEKLSAEFQIRPKKWLKELDAVIFTALKN